MTDSGYKLRYKDDDAVEVGLDEAGRGCLFGRLYVGAVVLTNDSDDLFDNGATLSKIKDSKVLTKRQRDILFDYVNECALDKSVCYAEAAEVDALNVLQADLTTMHRCLDALTVPVERVLADGDHWRPYKDTEGYAIVDGDAQYLAIAAAGILAKVSRDNWVKSVVAAHPDWDEKYGLSSNMGYGTAKHMTGIEKHGVTGEHRRSFRPVAVALGLPVKEKFQSKGVRKPKKAAEDTNWIGVEEEGALLSHV
jgi:ribonuclease HII